MTTPTNTRVGTPALPETPPSATPAATAAVAAVLAPILREIAAIREENKKQADDAARLREKMDALQKDMAHVRANISTIIHALVRRCAACNGKGCDGCGKGYVPA